MGKKSHLIRRVTVGENPGGRSTAQNIDVIYAGTATETFLYYSHRQVSPFLLDLSDSCHAIYIICLGQPDIGEYYHLFNRKGGRRLRRKVRYWYRLLGIQEMFAGGRADVRIM